MFLETLDPQILEALKEGKVQEIRDQQEKQTQRFPIPFLPFEGIRSCMFVPLLSQDSLIGSLNLGLGSSGGFTSEQLEIAREVANQMAVALHNAHLYEELHAAHQRLQMLNHRLLEAQETERHHLARELHDEMGQALTFLRIQLEEIDIAAMDASLSNRLKESTALIVKILDQVRNLSLDLRPLILDDLGLAAAVRWYVSRKSQITGFAVNFQSDLDNVQLPAEIETACFRVAQEAVTNILRHSGAKHVSLDLSKRNGEILFSIRDDGIGFDVEKAHKRSLKGESLGLLGMRERISLLGGQLEIESVPSCGTEVRVRVPLQTKTKT
jgi:signal transduction histidine kinase